MPKVNFKLAIVWLMLINGTVSVSDTDWWKHTTIYEVYIPSFKDSNGDGLGDIRGVIEKLDYFVELGIETIYLSPFCKSPMLDFGYDVSDYTEVNPLFGTMQDFDELVREIKKRGLKLIMDLVLNHSSDEHPWFNRSVERIEPYTDFYVWIDAKGFDMRGNPIPPNNWVSVFDNSAWKWNDKRKQFYLHQFNVKQPEFNLRNVLLIKELKNILKFWMKKGVAGFRLDATRHYIEDQLLRDEPITNPSNIQNWHSYDHIYTVDLWESYELIHNLRNYIDQYSDKKDEKYERILIAEAYTSINYTMAYYGTKTYSITHFPFNFDLVLMKSYHNASAFNDQILSWLDNMPKGSVANWVAENHDNPRIGTKYSDEYSDLITTMIMTLPGIACIYYGQEIGMTNNRVRLDQRQDPNILPDTRDNRDGERLPMHWDDTANAGFTSKSKTWLPVASNYWRVNVETQKSQKFSRYHIFTALSQLRKKKTMKFGQFKSYVVSEWVYAFTRSLRSYETYLTVLNLGTETEMIDLNAAIAHLPKNLEVVVASLNAGYVPGDRIQSRPRFPNVFPMRPLSAVVLSSKLHSTPSKFPTLSNRSTSLLSRILKS